MAARAKGCVWEIEEADATATGLTAPEAEAFVAALQRVTAAHPRKGAEAAVWAAVAPLLRPEHPHALHQLVYYSIYANWDGDARGPPPYWFPSPIHSRNTNIGRLMEKYGPNLLGSSYKNPIASFMLFQKFTADHPEVYWSIILKELAIKFLREPKSILDTSDEHKNDAVWLPGAVFNIAESCLLPAPVQNKNDDDLAVVWSNEEHDVSTVHSMTLKELREQVMMVANALDKMFKKGDAIAIVMPMTCKAVIIYMAIVLSGFIVVSIADSFAAKEIGMRINVSKVTGIFTQDFITRGGRTFPLYSRVTEGTLCKAVVISSTGKELSVQLRNHDLSWKDFLFRALELPRPSHYSPVYSAADEVTNILFSSGTTGNPKAIPWTQLSSIRCASENWAHLDIHAGDVFCLPTTLGWVAGPILLYSCFINGATLALYHGSPLGRGFGKFVQDAGVTILGTVPSLVKAWKNSNCIEGLDWTKIRVFASVGEASNVDDDLWLSSRAFYKPIIELCGGTELASGFLGGSPLQAQAFGACSCPTLSTKLFILDDRGIPFPDDQPCVGEVALSPLYMGATSWLLNADHRKVYFDGMPVYKGMQLRRHGDIVRRTPEGYYLVQGRLDDTMNLGGIKTSSVEIERACNGVDERVLEVAAVGIKPSGGGPENLAIFAVLKDGKSSWDINLLMTKFQKAIQNNLNPLFKVSYLKIVPEFPRTATNKLLRRVLRDQLRHELSNCSKL